MPYISNKTNIDLYQEYKESRKGITDYKIANMLCLDYAREENINEIIKDLNEVLKELKKRFVYESLKKEDLLEIKLTKRQEQIALLRQKYTCTEVANILGIPPSTVFITYNVVLNKVLRYKEKIKEKIPPVLSKQQIDIYFLYIQGSKNAQIAEQLNISVDTVKTQLKRIKKKMNTGNKSI